MGSEQNIHFGMPYNLLNLDPMTKCSTLQCGLFLAEDCLGWELKVFGMADDVKAGEDAVGFAL